jgi:hypothetical protein
MAVFNCLFRSTDQGRPLAFPHLSYQYSAGVNTEELPEVLAYDDIRCAYLGGNIRGAK